MMFASYDYWRSKPNDDEDDYQINKNREDEDAELVESLNQFMTPPAIDK